MEAVGGGRRWWWWRWGELFGVGAGCTGERGEWVMIEMATRCASEWNWWVAMAKGVVMVAVEYERRWWRS